MGEPAAGASSRARTFRATVRDPPLSRETKNSSRRSMGPMEGRCSGQATNHPSRREPVAISSWASLDWMRREAPRVVLGFPREPRMSTDVRRDESHARAGLIRSRCPPGSFKRDANIPRSGTEISASAARAPALRAAGGDRATESIGRGAGTQTWGLPARARTPLLLPGMCFASVRSSLRSAMRSKGRKPTRWKTSAISTPLMRRSSALEPNKLWFGSAPHQTETRPEGSFRS